jgi:CHAT domain-containing protein
MDPAACRSADQLDGTLPPFDAEAAWQVWHRLIEPVAAPLAGARRIFVTASGRLGELPFAALVTEQPQPGQATAWFGDRASFTLLPSVAALRAIPRTNRGMERRPRYVAYGAPELGRTASAVPGAPQAMPKGLANPAMLRAAFGPLTTAGREMQEVAQAMGADMTAVHLDTAATEAAVRADSRIGVARIVHFATHGLLPDTMSATPILGEPGLVFTPPAMPSEADDGVLSASEVSDMRLSAEWLILSACTTATAGGGEAAIGDPDSLGVLSRAFLFAGARRLVASHWNLSAVTGRLLVTNMLKAVTIDPALPPSEALARTQRALRTGVHADGSPVFGWDRDWQHPFFWAPLSIIAYDDDA